jgi:hypothetical protein
MQISFFYFKIECKLNVHKRCTRNVANDCGLDKKKLATVLADLNISTEPQKMVNIYKKYFIYLFKILFYSDNSTK